MTKVHHRASRPLPFFPSFFFSFPSSISLHSVFLPVSRGSQTNGKYMQMPRILPSFERANTFPPPLLALHRLAPSLHLVPRPSSSMPFCIPGAYHLRVRHPRNRSVSRNNTRCHGHPSIRQRIPMLPSHPLFVLPDQRPWIEIQGGRKPPIFRLPCLLSLSLEALLPLLLPLDHV